MQKILHKPSTPNSQLKNFTKIYKLVAARTRGARTAAEPPSDAEKRAEEEEGPPEAPDPAKDHVRRLTKTLFYNPIAYSTKRSSYTPVSKARRADPIRLRCRVDLEPLTYLSDLSRVMQVSSVRCRSEGPQAFSRPLKKKKVRIAYPTKGTRCRSEVWNLEGIEGVKKTQSNFTEEGECRVKELQVQRQSLAQFESEDKPTVLLRRAFPGSLKSRILNPLNVSKYKPQGSQNDLRSKTTSNINKGSKLSLESFMRYDVWNGERSVTASPKFLGQSEEVPKVSKLDQKLNGSSREFKEYTVMSLGSKTAVKSKGAGEQSESNKFTFSRSKHSMRKEDPKRPGDDHHVLSLSPTRSSRTEYYSVHRSDHSVKIIPKTYRMNDVREGTLGPDPIMYVEQMLGLHPQAPLPPRRRMESEKKVIEDNDDISICSTGHSVEFIPKSYSKINVENVPTFAQKRNDFTTSSRFGKVDDLEDERVAGEGDDVAVSEVIQTPKPPAADTESPVSRLLRQTSKRVDFLDEIGKTVPGDSFSVCRTGNSVEIVPKTWRNDEGAGVQWRRKSTVEGIDKRFPNRKGGGGGGNHDEAGFDFTICKTQGTVEIIPLANQKRNGSEHNLERDEEKKADETWKKNPYQKLATTSRGSETNSKAYPPNKLKSHAPEKKNVSGRFETTTRLHEKRLDTNNETKMPKLEEGDQRTVKKQEQTLVESTRQRIKTTPTRNWIYQKKRPDSNLGSKPNISVAETSKKTPSFERFTLGDKHYNICKSGDTVEIQPSTPDRLIIPRTPKTRGIVGPAREVYSLNAAPKKMRFLDATEGARARRPMPAKSWEFVISKSDHSIEITPRQSTSSRTRPLEGTVTQVLSLNLGEERPADCLVSRCSHSVGFTPTVYGRGREEEEEPQEAPGRVKYRLGTGTSSVAGEVKRKLERASKTRMEKSPSRYRPEVKLKTWDGQKAEEYPQPLFASTNRAKQEISESADAKDYKSPNAPPKHSLETKEDSQICRERPPPQQIKDTQNVHLMKSTNNEGKDEKETNPKVMRHQNFNDNHQKDDKLINSDVVLSSKIYNFYLSKLDKGKHNKQETRTVNPQAEKKYPNETNKPEKDEPPSKLTQGSSKVDKKSKPQSEHTGWIDHKITRSCNPNKDTSRIEKPTPGTLKTTSPYKSQPVLTHEEPKASRSENPTAGTLKTTSPYKSQPVWTQEEPKVSRSEKPTPGIEKTTSPYKSQPVLTQEEPKASMSQKPTPGTEKTTSPYKSQPVWTQEDPKASRSEKPTAGTLKTTSPYKSQPVSTQEEPKACRIIEKPTPGTLKTTSPYKSQPVSTQEEPKASRSEKTTPGIEKTTSSYKSQPVLTQEEPKAQEKKRSYVSQPTLTKFQFVCLKDTTKIDAKTTKPQIPPKDEKVADSTYDKQKQKVEVKSEKPNLAYSTFYKYQQVPPKEETNTNQTQGTLYLKLLESYKVDVEKTRDTSYQKDQPCTEKKKEQMMNVKNFVKEIEAREKKKESKLKGTFSKPKNLHKRYVPIKKEEEVVPVKKPNTITNIMQLYQFNERKVEKTVPKGRDLMEETKREVVNWKSINKVVSEALQKNPPKEPRTQRTPKSVPSIQTARVPCDLKLGTVHLNLKPNSKDHVKGSTCKESEPLHRSPKATAQEAKAKPDQIRTEDPKLSSCKQPKALKQETIRLGPKPDQLRTEDPKLSPCKEPRALKLETNRLGPKPDQIRTEDPKPSTCKEFKASKQKTNRLGTKPDQLRTEDPKISSCKEPIASKQDGLGLKPDQLRTEDPKISSCKEPRAWKQATNLLGPKPDQIRTEDPKLSSCKESRVSKPETNRLRPKPDRPKPEDPKQPSKEPKFPSNKEIRIDVATKSDQPVRFSLILNDNEAPTDSPKSKLDPDHEEVEVNIIEANRPGMKKEKPPSEPDRKKKERPKSKERDVVLPPAVVDKDLKLQQEIRGMLKDLTRTVSKELLKEERETQRMLRELKEKIENEKRTQYPLKVEEPKGPTVSNPVGPVDLTKPQLVTVKEKLYFQHLSKDGPRSPPQKRPKRPPRSVRKQSLVRLEKVPRKATLPKDPKSLSTNETKHPILNVEKVPSDPRAEKQKLKFKPKRSKTLKRRSSDLGKKTPVTPPPTKACFYGLEQKDPEKTHDEGDSKTATAPVVMDRKFTTSSRYRNMLDDVVVHDEKTPSPPKSDPLIENRRNLLRPYVEPDIDETDSGKAPNNCHFVTPNNAEPAIKATVDRIIPKGSSDLRRFNKRLATLEDPNPPFFKIRGVTVEKKIDYPKDPTPPKRPANQVRVTFRPKLCTPFTDPSKAAMIAPETTTLSKNSSAVLFPFKRPEKSKPEEDYKGLKITFMQVKRVRKGRDVGMAELIQERYDLLKRLHQQFCEENESDEVTRNKNMTKELIDKLKRDDETKPEGSEK